MAKSKMSEYIPFEIQEQIMKRLPVKTLIQFKMVSKPWKALIESSEFMADYNRSQTGPHHLFIRYDNHYNQSEELKHVSIVDDDTFPQHRFVPTVPESFKLLNRKPSVVGSSHGLFCLHGEYTCAKPLGGSFPNNVNMLIVIWNPSINKSVVFDELVYCDIFPIILGFGVRPDTLDPMIVKINDQQDLSWRFEVIRLSTGVRTIPTSNLPRKSIQFTFDNHVAVNGFMYWYAFDKVASLIVSFDMKSEKFEEVTVPKCLASKGFHISKLRESLALLEYYKEAEAQKQACAVWMMTEDGGQKLFTKLYTISTQDTLLSIVPGFRNRGKAIVGTRTVVVDRDHDHKEPVLLSVYEPHSKNIDSPGIYGASGSLFVSSYTESLLLLDHPDNHGKPVQTRLIKYSVIHHALALLS